MGWQAFKKSCATTREVQGPLIAVLLLFVLLAVLPGCGGPSTVDLKMQFEAGKTYRINETADLVTELGAPAAASIQEHSDMARELEVTAVNDDGSAEMTLTIVRARHDLAGMPAGVEFPVGKLIRGGEDLTYTLTFTPKGEVRDISANADVFDHVMDAVGSVPGASEAQLRPLLDSMYGVESVASDLELSVGIYPDEPVDVGSTWTKSKDWFNMGEKQSVQQTYEITERVNGLLTIKCESDISPIGDGMQGTITETITVSESTGWIQGATATYDLHGDFPLPGISMEAKITGRSNTDVY